MKSSPDLSPLKAFIERRFLGGATMEQGLKLVTGGVVDSMGIVLLVDFMEKTYGITIAAEDVTPDRMDTLDGLGELIARSL